MKNLRERFAYIRTQKGYTQMALAEAIGVTRGVISNIEYGKTDPPQIVINAVCGELNINKEWLQNGIGPIEPENERSKILDELYQICSTLTEAQQMYLLDQIRVMKKHNILQQENEPTVGRRPALDDIMQNASVRRSNRDR